MAAVSMSDVHQLIAKLVEDKTLSVEAAEGVKLLRDRAKKLEDENIDLQTKQSQLRTENSQLGKKVTELTEERNSVLERESKVIAREKDANALELKLAVAAAKFEVLDKTVEKLLANRQIRESVYSQTQRYEPYSGGGGTWMQKPENHSTDRTEG